MNDLNLIRDFLFLIWDRVIYLYATNIILSIVMAIFVLRKISKLIEKLR